jgi:hypothetical protein
MNTGQEARDKLFPKSERLQLALYILLSIAAIVALAIAIGCFNAQFWSVESEIESFLKTSS